jgi:diguanylate cyclase (GGDEF)-like protein
MGKIFSGLKSIRAGRAFALLAALFVMTFGATVVLIGLDQQQVLDATTRLQAETVPEIIRYQRLARNLEQLRHEGERVFAAGSLQSRQQAMFVVTLGASHPSMLEHREAADLARQVERFLADVVRQTARDETAIAANLAEWQRLAARLGLLVDDISIQGINLVTTDLGDVSAAMKLARIKLTVALLVVGLFLFIFLILLRAHLIHPLQRIDQALSGLSVERPAPEFKPSAMVGIQVVEDAIGELLASLLLNEAARDALEVLASMDGLSGLTNRRHFMLLADAELQRAQRYRRSVSVGMADLDFFKKLNDTYGHAAGDTVLRAVSALMQETLRQSDIVGRYGGEEFAFIFPESTLAESASLAERIRARCAEYDIRLADGRMVRVTLSIGLADASESPIEIALKHADDALYEAKHQGRNRVVVAGGEVPVDLPLGA